MSPFDYAVLGIVGLSIIVSVWRGAVREVLALASWIIAFIAAQAYAPAAAAYLPAALENASLRLLAAFAGVFLSVFLLTTLTAIAISKLVRAAGLGPADRALGAIFGLVRGMLVVLTFVLLGGLTAAPRLPAWRDAMLSPPLEAAAGVVKDFLPVELARKISYE
jgi:membrane protein required for colicin V production